MATSDRKMSQQAAHVTHVNTYWLPSVGLTECFLTGIYCNMGLHYKASNAMYVLNVRLLMQKNRWWDAETLNGQGYKVWVSALQLQMNQNHM